MKIPRRVTVQECEQILNSGWSKQKIVRIIRVLLSHKKNFDTFCYLFFPAAFNEEFASGHYDLIEVIFTDDNEAQAQPRGSGKSTILGLGYVAWLVAYDKEKYIPYISQSHTKSVQFLIPIKIELATNERFNFIYGPFNIGKAKDKYGRDREDCFDINNKTRIEAISFEKNIRGIKFGIYRPTIIILDDIEDDERVVNPILRMKDAKKLNNIVIPALDKRGRIKFIGTILHYASLLMNKINKYDGIILKAENPDGTPAYPGTLPKELLIKRLHDIGPLSYQQEYMNEPVADVTAIIKSEWVRSCFDETLSYGHREDFEMRTSGLDPSFSDAVTADFTAIACVGLNTYRDIDEKKGYTGKYTLFHAEWQKGWSITRQLRRIGTLNKLYRLDNNGLEENSIKAISAELKNMVNFNYRLFWLGRSDPAKTTIKTTPATLAEFRDKRHTIGKFNLINRLGTRFWNKELRIPYKTPEDKEISNRLLDECTSWSLQDGKVVEAGIHPDMPIALGYALELMEGQTGVIDI